MNNRANKRRKQVRIVLRHTVALAKILRLPIFAHSNENAARFYYIINRERLQFNKSNILAISPQTCYTVRERLGPDFEGNERARLSFGRGGDCHGLY